MKDEKQHLNERVALFRHALVARLVAEDMSGQERQLEIDKIVATEHQIPGSLRTRVAENTLRDWLRQYRQGGFEALIPKQRIDAGHPRALTPEVSERLLQIKEKSLDLSMRLIIAQVREEGLIHPHQQLPITTVHRLFKQHGLTGRDSTTGQPNDKDRRRFAYQYAGQFWMSDVMHGPAIVKQGRRKHKTYLIAFLDDATRVITHARFAFSENTRTFLPIFKQALLRRGVPQRLYVDNGANYRSHHFALVCAKLDIALIHARPHQPQGKGKIERFFRTCRAQLISRLTEQDSASINALNRRLAGWIEAEYHQTPHRGLDGQTPLQRWSEAGEQLRYPDPTLDLDDLFLFEEKRTVHKDRTVSLHGRVYEVDATLVGQSVVLRYDPANPEAPIQVVHNGQLVETARQVDLYANCFVKRQRQTDAFMRVEDPSADNEQADNLAQQPPALNMQSLNSKNKAGDQ